MRVVCFWSFKGGVGRSLALANLASILARLGKNVLCLDLDLEAPSLPHIFDVADPKYGFVNFALDWLSGGPAAVDSDVRNLVMRVRETESLDRGQVGLVAAGGTATDETRDAYWDAIIGGQLGVLFPPPMFADPKWEPEFSSFEGLYKGFWGAFLTELEHSNPKWDFLLVDTRPGLSPLSTASLGIFRGAPDLLVGEDFSAEALWNISPWIADLVLFADPSSPPTLPGIREFLKRLSSDAEIAKDRRVTLVTRVPGSLEVSTGSKFDAQDWLGEVSDRVHAFERLASDPSLEKDGRMLVPLSGPVEYRPPLNSYLRICLAAFEMANVIPSSGRVRDQLLAFRSMLGVQEGERPHDYKLFELPAGGRMFNIRDREPNISLRVETLHSLLDSLWADVEQRGLPEGLGPGLRQAGRAAGTRFGSVHFAARAGAATGDREAIEEWCDFDSRVGWGLLDPVFAERGNLVAVNVYNNAFAVRLAEDDEDVHNFCDFLSGYFEGVLSELLQKDVTVGQHPPELCIRGGSRDACTFTLETA